MAQNVTINGVSYADVPSISVPLSGGDELSGTDAAILSAILFDTGEVTITPQQRLSADVNGDGIVNGADVTALYNLLLN